MPKGKQYFWPRQNNNIIRKAKRLTKKIDNVAVKQPHPSTYDRNYYLWYYLVKYHRVNYSRWTMPFIFI